MGHVTTDIIGLLVMHIWCQFRPNAACCIIYQSRWVSPAVLNRVLLDYHLFKS